jgi:N-acetylneuraminate synthase
VYAKRDLPAGHVLTDEDYYLAIPLQKGQLSCRELITGDPLVGAVRQDEPITIECFDNPYSRPGFLHQVIAGRGIDRPTSSVKASSLRVVGDASKVAKG